MSRAILVIGRSGTGKSTSIRNLDPKETAIIQVIEKDLPFRGWKNKYNSDNKNFARTDKAKSMLSNMKNVDENRPEIKILIIDDFQYIMANEFMRRSEEKGYQKFSDIGNKAWQILQAARKLRDDLTVIILTHSEVNDIGEVKMKTIGKMLDDKITPEGMFSIMFESIRTEDGYFFRTNGVPAKSPMGMFDKELVDNDLKAILETIKNYDEGE